jgi:hypothetical protein
MPTGERLEAGSMVARPKARPKAHCQFCRGAGELRAWNRRNPPTCSKRIEIPVKRWNRNGDADEHVLVTVRDWLRFAASRFNAAGLVYGHGTTNALDEAAFLILHALHLPIDKLDPWLDARLLADERRAVR